MKTTLGAHHAEGDGVDLGRRNALRLAVAGMATLGVMPFVNISIAKAQDMANGANNFYTSDKVNLQRSRSRTNTR